MALFRKPKEEGLKPLSEKDIQQRLYGFFHQERPLPPGVPPKKTTKSAELKSLEVTPAGILQTELFRAETPTTASDEQTESYEKLVKEFQPQEEAASQRIHNSEFANKTNYSSDFQNSEEVNGGFSEEDEGPAHNTANVRKPVRRAQRKTRKDKKRSEIFKKNMGIALENALALTVRFFGWLSRVFSAFVLWLGESRGESKRVPAKFILVSLAVIGTGLIFFNVWSTHVKQNAQNFEGIPSLQGRPVNNSVVNKLIPVQSDAISKVKQAELSKAASTIPLEPAKKYFSVQVCVAQSESGALTVAKKLQDDGLPAFYDQGVSRRGSTLYRVMLGKYESFQTAKSQLEAFKKKKVMEPYQDSFIRNLTA